MVFFAVDTVLLFTKQEIHALSGAKKTQILQQVSDACAAVGVSLVLHTKAKKEDGSGEMDKVIAAARAADNPVIGHLPKVRSSDYLGSVYQFFVGSRQQ